MTAARLGTRSRSLAWTALAATMIAAAGCGSSPGGDGPADAAGAGGAMTGTGAGGATTTIPGTGGATGTGGTTGSGGAGAGGARATGGADGGVTTPTGGATGSGGTGTGGGTTATGGKTGTGGMAGAAGTANITVWLSGDSTMATGGPSCPIGWGGKFQPHFNTHATVVNSAISGTSINDWLYSVSTTLGADGECVLNNTTFQPAWTAMLNGMKAGDYLLIQFGINDTDPTCPKHESTDKFMADLGMMAQSARDRGANPIFLSSVSSIACTGSSAIPTRGRFAAAARQAAVTYNVPLIDLEALSVTLYTSLGFCPLPGADVAATYESGAIGAFFCEDHTHFESAGAVQIATLVAQSIKDQAFGLAAYLVP
jgi:lysophospholipase L1-like esterase